MCGHFNCLTGHSQPLQIRLDENEILFVFPEGYQPPPFTPSLEDDEDDGPVRATAAVWDVVDSLEIVLLDIWLGVS